VYRKTGDLKVAGVDHRNDDTTIQYIENRVTKYTHEKTIGAAIEDFHGHFSGKVVADNTTMEEALDIISAGDERGRSIMSGDQDVFIASCSDFYNRPGSVPGLPCDKPWLCFQCKNSIWTTRTLPRLLLFLDFLSDQKDLIPDGEWQRKFGGVNRVINEDIIPKFSERALAHARSEASLQELYLPVEFRAV
jgi:hypothetical protein